MIARLLKQATFLALLALLPSLVSGFVQFRTLSDKDLEEGEIRVATARTWGAQAQWVDARTAERFQSGHIPGAFRLTLAEWEQLLPAFLDYWDPDKKLVVYCDSGDCDASETLAERMRHDLQIKEVYTLQGGWPAWQGR